MHLYNPALTFALALAAGILAQSAAIHLRVPGIVLLLLTGTLLGPDVAGVLQPDSLGPALEMIVGLSVAVVLFEGGLNLNIGRLRREAVVIRRLITVGAAITAVGAMLAVHWIMGWSWSVAILFGTLVMVTGPTVTTPILRRLRVSRNVATILRAEAVLIDPLGAIIAVVALEVVLTETTGGAALGLLGLPSRLVVGALTGVIGGAAIAGILRYQRIVPEGLENVFTLSLVLALYQISDAIQHESGILTVVVAGMVVGNVRSRVARELRDFKEQLSIMLVGMLFVLLAADVRLAHVVALGWAGVATVLVLMFVVRPVDALACTWGSSLTWKERGFIAWLGPRGIVAAAVSSIFAERLTAAGFAAGTQLQALVFLVIAVTVVVQGLSGGPIASLLGVRRPQDQGYALVGANALGRALARVLASLGEETVLIDTNPSEARAAEAEGLRVVFGNANDEGVLQRADVESRRGFIAATPNEGANLLLAQRAKRETGVPATYVALARKKAAVTAERAEEAGARILFGHPVDLDGWIYAIGHEDAEVQGWRYEGEEETQLPEPPTGHRAGEGAPPLLPLVLVRGGSATPVDAGSRVRNGDVVVFAVRTGVVTATPVALGIGEWSLVESPDLAAAESEAEAE